MKEVTITYLREPWSKPTDYPVGLNFPDVCPVCLAKASNPFLISRSKVIPAVIRETITLNARVCDIHKKDLELPPQSNWVLLICTVLFGLLASYFFLSVTERTRPSDGNLFALICLAGFGFVGGIPVGAIVGLIANGIINRIVHGPEPAERKQARKQVLDSLTIKSFATPHRHETPGAKLVTITFAVENDRYADLLASVNGTKTDS